VELRALLNEVDDRPVSFLTVTTRDPDTPLPDFVRAMQSVVQRLRRRHPSFDYYGTIEGTSGRLARDGRRRMHGHFICKGIPDVDCGTCEMLARATWECATFNRMGEAGRAWRVTLEPAVARDGIAVYVSGYLGKESQVMDGDWGGRRIRCSQRFFREGRVRARERALGELLGESAGFAQGFAKGSWGYDLARAAGGEGRVMALERALERKAMRAEFAASSVADDAPDVLDHGCGVGAAVAPAQLSFDVADDQLRHFDRDREF